jgi:hypothetical protein
MDNPTGFSESFILGLIASLGAFVGMIFGAFRKSRCSNIDCCWGMYKCNREVLTNDELALEPPTPTLQLPHNKNEVIV